MSGEFGQLEVERLREFLAQLMTPEALDRVMERAVPMFGGLTPTQMAERGRAEEALAIYRMVFSYQVPL